ncbi:hypothetical protein QSE00_18170 [Arenibacter sp. M-2]|nr:MULTISPECIES: hypothetical protein [unclassified Arenibacter]MDL5513753.1 hypothetical protein [Arenibacter sp. M-2]PXX23986.1 hypothetical protein C7972_11737 [Arenibacter sp. ARW7G5Y1]
MDRLKTVKTILFGINKSQFKGYGRNSILILNEDREYIQWLDMEMYKW